MKSDMNAVLKKLKELKMKMAALENMEGDEHEGVDLEEGEAPQSSAIAALEKKDDVDALDNGVDSDVSSDISDDDMMELMGKKKKVAPKSGMKIAIAMKASKPKAMGKYK